MKATLKLGAVITLAACLCACGYKSGSGMGSGGGSKYPMAVRLIMARPGH